MQDTAGVCRDNGRWKRGKGKGKEDDFVGMVKGNGGGRNVRGGWKGN